MPGATLGRNLKDRLLDALMNVPGTDERAGRTALLNGIPANVKASLNRADNQFVDMTNVLDQLENLGRLRNGERPLVIITHNGWRVTRGTELGQTLMDIEGEVEAAYGDEEPLAELPARPEVLIFGGEGEWVTDAYVEHARLVGRRVARLRIPRFEGGVFVRPVGGVGTGWVIAPRLLITNHHVIEAREDGEPAASEVDIARQGQQSEAWFDYHREGQEGIVVGISEVVASNRDLDYALLRLKENAALPDRRQIALAPEKPALSRGARLNIVQCPGGGPLRYAIRNNFFVGLGEYPYQVRYLTDTKKGSSGSPVLDDNWQVVALHHGAREVDPELYRGEARRNEVVKYHNEGICIHKILSDLPTAVREEIKNAQSGQSGQLT